MLACALSLIDLIHEFLFLWGWYHRLTLTELWSFLFFLRCLEDNVLGTWHFLVDRFLSEEL